MTTLADYGIDITVNPPADLPKKLIFVKQDCDWSEAVELAIQCRKTHQKEAIELWPIGGSHRVHVVREVVQ